MKKTTKKQNERVKIIPLGGLDKIGMNITAIEYNDTIDPGGGGEAARH